MLYIILGGFGLLAENMKKCYPEMMLNVFDFDHVTRMAQEVKPNADIGWISGIFSVLFVSKGNLFDVFLS